MLLTKTRVYRSLTFLCIISLTILSAFQGNAQNEKVLQQAEVMPEFIGGNDALMKYLIENIQYPEDARKKKEEGKVYISFIVDEKGDVKNTQVKKGVSASLNAEALRVVNNMPAWKPGEQDGKKVKVEYTLPIMFALQ